MKDQQTRTATGAASAAPSHIAELSTQELAEWNQWREEDDRQARLYCAYGDWISA